jgi:hypothetical protein
MLGAHLFGLPNVSQAGLELAAEVATVAAISVFKWEKCSLWQKSPLVLN